MHWFKELGRFQLDDDTFSNNKVEPVDSDRLIAIVHRDHLLACKGNSSHAQLYPHSIAVKRLHESWSHVTMDHKSAINDFCNVGLGSAIEV